MYMQKLFLLQFTLYFTLKFCSNFEWTKSGFKYHKLNRILINDLNLDISNRTITRYLKFDLFNEEQITIVYYPKYNPVLFQMKIYCFLKGYENENRIIFYFCMGYKCVEINNYSGKLNIVNPLRYTVEYISKFETMKGLIVTLTFIEFSSDLSENYYCAARNVKNGLFIHSGIIQIRDLYYWKNNMVLYSDRMTIRINKTLTNKDLPMKIVPFSYIIKNPPMWFSQELPNKIDWLICYNDIYKKVDSSCFKKFISSTACDSMLYCGQKIENSPYLNGFINSYDNSLIITHILTYSSYKTLKLGIYSFHIGKNNLEVINDSNYNYNQKELPLNFIYRNILIIRPLKLLSPIYQNITLYASQMNNRLFDPFVAVIYHGSFNFTYSWYYNNVLLVNSNRFQLEQYRLIFKGKIDDRFDGKYEIKVNQKIGGKYEKISAFIFLKVIISPKIKFVNRSYWPKKLYYFENFRKDDSYSFIIFNNPTNVELKINNFTVNLLENKENMTIILDALQKKYEIYLYLNVMYIKSSFYLYSTISSSKIDFAITLFVTNSLLTVRKQTLIYLLPNLTSTMTSNFPSYQDCISQCYFTKSYIFYCRFNYSKYDDKEIFLDHYWTLKHYRLNNDNDKTISKYLSEAFSVDKHNKDLTLKPISEIRNETFQLELKHILQNNEIICHLDIKSENGIFEYKSHQDPLENFKLKIQIKLSDPTYDSRIYYWIGIALICFIVLGISLACYHQFFAESESYNFETIEKIIRDINYHNE